MFALIRGRISGSCADARSQSLAENHSPHDTHNSSIDFGQSLWTGHAVIDEVWTRLPLSLELAVIATAFAVSFALPLGVLAAVKQDSWVDYGIRIFSVGGLATGTIVVVTW